MGILVVRKKRPADLSIVKRLGGFSHCKDSTNFYIYKKMPTLLGSASGEKEYLNGSALGDGMDWMMRKMPSVSATSVNRFFPSAACSFNW